MHLQPQVTDCAETEPVTAPDESDLVRSLLQENERLQAEVNRQRERADLFRSVFECLPDALAIAEAAAQLSKDS